MLRPNDYDVLIAGAGPAGAHTALRLARQGWKVGLLDSRHFPRKKPCGEFLSPACLPLLDELGLLERLEAAGAAKVSGMNILTAKHATRGDYLPIGPFASSHGFGLGMRRELLDHQALEAAAAEPDVDVLLGWRVSEPLRDGAGRATGLSVTDPDGSRLELRSRFVVAADGLHSRVARGLGWAKPRSGPDRFAIVARFEGVEQRCEAELHVAGQNYFAACPIDGGQFTANLVLGKQQLPKGAGALEACFREHLGSVPVLAERLAGARLTEPLAACGPLRAAVRRCTGPGAALVGDACGFVDPMTGEGLFFAMQGAQLLSAAVHEALRDPQRERQALRGYARARRREFGPRYALARLLQGGLRRPGVPDKLVGALERVPALGHLLLGLTGDYVPPRGLLLPSVWSSALRHGRPAAD